MGEVSAALKRQQGKMKAAWTEVKRKGLTGKAARTAVGQLLKSPVKSHGGARAGAGRPKGRKTKRTGPKVKRPLRSPPKAGRVRQIPFGMGAVDIASGQFRDPAQNVQRTFTSVATLESIAARVATSQVGIRPTFRNPWTVRLMLSAGVM